MLCFERGKEGREEKRGEKGMVELIIIVGKETIREDINRLPDVV